MSNKLTRRQFLATTAAATTLPFLGNAAAAPAETTAANKATISISNPHALKLLQFTDVHFFAEKNDPEQDKRTIEALPRLVEQAQPDLLIVTGDLWHENPDHRGHEYQEFAIDQLAALGVPWMFTWGNHDQVDDFNKGHIALAQAKNSLYRGVPDDGNYVVTATDHQGNPVWDFLCLNTHRMGIQKRQQQWLKMLSDAQNKETQAPGAFAAFHIPIHQYITIWQNKAASGVKREKVCNQEEKGASLPFLQDIDNLKACICGHDHVNDYAGTIGGIELCYGRATGYGGYGEEEVPKGAKLYTIDTTTQSWYWESLCPDGSRWHPKYGEQSTRPLRHRKPKKTA